ncbi:esterase family protein [Limnohabitans sp. T6-5]|uniref:alpha/beta hydrolase n=1 Tax=Limnohabitans sp. T6-5 TaxID=1100724 RepID=UPI0018EE9782|nr:alpha/beta hydrolase-fold protein [Limnohabitans sp. T6-5]
MKLFGLMKRFAMACGLALCLIHLSAATAGEVTARSMKSAALNADFKYTIYLPDGYDNGRLRYPVLYLLHGNGGNENEWLVSGQVHPTVDKLIQSGSVQPFIIVMPGAGSSWWVNGNKDRAEDALIKELIPHIDATYRTISAREGRMVAGLSAGGFGTANAVMKFPEMFVSAAALSPAIYSPTPPSHSSAMRVAPFQKDGKFDQASWDRLNYTANLDTYKAKKLVVPMYINSGDHDTFSIAYHAAGLFQKLFEYQPKMVEYRVVDGDHEWSVWRDSIGDAIKYMTRFAVWPIGTKP